MRKDSYRSFSFVDIDTELTSECYGIKSSSVVKPMTAQGWNAQLV